MSAEAQQPWQIADLSLADLLKKGKPVARERQTPLLDGRRPVASPIDHIYSGAPHPMFGDSEWPGHDSSGPSLNRPLDPPTLRAVSGQHGGRSAGDGFRAADVTHPWGLHHGPGRRISEQGAQHQRIEAMAATL